MVEEGYTACDGTLTFDAAEVGRVGQKLNRREAESGRVLDAQRQRLLLNGVTKLIQE